MAKSMGIRMSKRELEESDLEEGELVEEINESSTESLTESGNSDADKEELMQYAILPMKRPDSDVPMTGEEYLFLVRQERNRLPRVVTCQNVNSESISIDQIIKHESKSPLPADVQLLPSKEWKEQMLEAYTKDRKTWADHIQEYEDGLNDDEELTLPKMSDESAWEKFLNSEVEPSLAVFSTLGHVAKMRLLLYHSRWIESKLSDRHYRWIYCLLANTLEGLSAEDMSILRALCRRCIRLRFGINPDDIDWDYLSNLNAIIAIITVFYNQHDLDTDDK